MQTSLVLDPQTPFQFKLGLQVGEVPALGTCLVLYCSLVVNLYVPEAPIAAPRNHLQCEGADEGKSIFRNKCTTVVVSKTLNVSNSRSSIRTIFK